MDQGSLTKNLTDSLQELIKLYGSLFSLLQSEKKHLIGADLDALIENNKTKEILLYKIREVDKQREQNAKLLASHLSITAVQPRLLEIAKKLPAELAKQLQQMHQTISMQVERVVELNKENEQYAVSALQTLDGAMTDIKQTVTTKVTYGKQGKLADSTETNAGNFVRKEV